MRFPVGTGVLASISGANPIHPTQWFCAKRKRTLDKGKLIEYSTIESFIIKNKTVESQINAHNDSYEPQMCGR
jgi:hypothetical protein